jgi:hypothetical protein
LDMGKSFDDQHRESCNKLFNIFEKTVSSGSRVIVLDDGAMLLSVFNENFGKIKEDIKILGIEQTSSGFRKLEHGTLQFPVVNVARSIIKLTKESPFIVENIIEKLDEYILEKKLKNKEFLIIGLGPIGKTLVDVLQKSGEKVTGFDTGLGHKDLVGKIMYLKPNIIIGATGTSVISQKDIEIMNSLSYPIYLVSVSSSDREFPVAAYRKDKDLRIHSDVNYGNIIFVNNGFPLNFKGNRHKEGTETIERTICLLLGSVLYLASDQNSADLTKGFIDVPKRITDIL